MKELKRIYFKLFKNKSKSKQVLPSTKNLGKKHNKIVNIRLKEFLEKNNKNEF